MSEYASIYKKLIHIFHIIDSISLNLLTKLENINKCSLYNLNLIKFEKWTNKTLLKLQVFLENRKFIKTPCDCHFCNKVGFESINHAVAMLLVEIPRILRDIKKNIRNENPQEVIFFQ